MLKRPIIIDTDPGCDDFFAIMLASTYEGFDIKALTTVGGNAVVDRTTRNALDIVKLFGMKTRVAKGAGAAIMHPFDAPAGFVHGENGLGQVILETSKQEADPMKAWDCIYDEAVKAKGELELIPIGPLTNIGIALLKYPQLKTMIKQIVIMGGSVTFGNCLAYSEANIFHDPYAAHLVFTSGIPITMAGLDITSTALVPTEDILTSAEGIKNETIRDAVKQISSIRGNEPFHDVVAVASMMNDKIAGYSDYFVEVEYKSPSCYGRTVVDTTHTLGQKPNCRVITSYDVAEHNRMFKAMLQKF